MTRCILCKAKTPSLTKLLCRKCHAIKQQIREHGRDEYLEIVAKTFQDRARSKNPAQPNLGGQPAATRQFITETSMEPHVLESKAVPNGSEGGASTSTRSLSPADGASKAKSSAQRLSVEQGERVIAKHSYTGGQPRQLSFEKDAVIVLKTKLSNGWWQGTLEGTNQSGWFPASFVRAHPSNTTAAAATTITATRVAPTAATAVGTAAAASGATSSHNAAAAAAHGTASTAESGRASTSSPPLQQGPDSGALTHTVGPDGTRIDLTSIFVAKHEFRAEQSRQLSFPKKALIRVLAKKDNGWWNGELLTTLHGPAQATGWLPASYVRPFAAGGSTVRLARNGGALGFGIAGGKGSEQGDLDIFISAIVPDSRAALDDRLRRGDQILEVNGKSMLGRTHGEAVELLRAAGDVIEMKIIPARAPGRDSVVEPMSPPAMGGPTSSASTAAPTTITSSSSLAPFGPTRTAPSATTTAAAPAPGPAPASASTSAALANAPGDQSGSGSVRKPSRTAPPPPPSGGSTRHPARPRSVLDPAVGAGLASAFAAPVISEEASTMSHAAPPAATATATATATGTQTKSLAALHAAAAPSAGHASVTTSASAQTTANTTTRGLQSRPAASVPAQPPATGTALASAALTASTLAATSTSSSARPLSLLVPPSPARPGHTASTPQSPDNASAREMEVVVRKAVGAPLGLGIAGGMTTPQSKGALLGIKIITINPQGAAASTGQIQLRDTITRVGHISFVGIDHDSAVRVLQEAQSKSVVIFRVRRSRTRDSASASMNASTEQLDRPALHSASDEKPASPVVMRRKSTHQQQPEQPQSEEEEFERAWSFHEEIQDYKAQAVILERRLSQRRLSSSSLGSVKEDPTSSTVPTSPRSAPAVPSGPAAAALAEATTLDAASLAPVTLRDRGPSPADRRRGILFNAENSSILPRKEAEAAALPAAAAAAEPALAHAVSTATEFAASAALTANATAAASGTGNSSTTAAASTPAAVASQFDSATVGAPIDAHISSNSSAAITTIEAPHTKAHVHGPLHWNAVASHDQSSAPSLQHGSSAVSAASSEPVGAHTLAALTGTTHEHRLQRGKDASASAAVSVDHPSASAQHQAHSPLLVRSDLASRTAADLGDPAPTLSHTDATPVFAPRPAVVVWSPPGESVADGPVRSLDLDVSLRSRGTAFGESGTDGDDDRESDHVEVEANDLHSSPIPAGSSHRQLELAAAAVSAASHHELQADRVHLAAVEPKAIDDQSSFADQHISLRAAAAAVVSEADESDTALSFAQLVSASALDDEEQQFGSNRSLSSSHGNMNTYSGSMENLSSAAGLHAATGSQCGSLGDLAGVGLDPAIHTASHARPVSSASDTASSLIPPPAPAPSPRPRPVPRPRSMVLLDAVAPPPAFATIASAPSNPSPALPPVPAPRSSSRSLTLTPSPAPFASSSPTAVLTRDNEIHREEEAAPLAAPRSSSPSPPFVAPPPPTVVDSTVVDSSIVDSSTTLSTHSLVAEDVDSLSLFDVPATGSASVVLQHQPDAAPASRLLSDVEEVAHQMESAAEQRLKQDHHDRVELLSSKAVLSVSDPSAMSAAAVAAGCEEPTRHFVASALAAPSIVEPVAMVNATRDSPEADMPQAMVALGVHSVELHRRFSPSPGEPAAETTVHVNSAVDSSVADAADAADAAGAARVPSPRLDMDAAPSSSVQPHQPSGHSSHEQATLLPATEHNVPLVVPTVPLDSGVESSSIDSPPNPDSPLESAPTSATAVLGHSPALSFSSTSLVTTTAITDAAPSVVQTEAPVDRIAAATVVAAVAPATLDVLPAPATATTSEAHAPVPAQTTPALAPTVDAPAPAVIVAAVVAAPAKALTREELVEKAKAEARARTEALRQRIRAESDAKFKGSPASQASA